MINRFDALRARAARPFDIDPELRFWNEMPGQFVDLCRTKTAPGAVMPARDVLPPAAMTPFLPYLLIIDMDAGRQRYRNRLVGTQVAEHAGRDSTGKWFEEIYSPEVIAGHHRAHQWVIENRRPVRTYGTMAFVGRGYMPVEAAIVPVSVEIPDRVEQFFICVAYGSVVKP